MKLQFTLLMTVMCLAEIATGQTVYGVSALGITTSQVQTFSETYGDYLASYYYDFRADGFLFEDSSVVASGSATDPVDAYGYISRSWLANKTYTIQSNHWVAAYYQYWNGSSWQYSDPYGFSLISGGSSAGQDTYSPPMQQEYTVSPGYYIGSTYIQDNTNPPYISAINVLGSPVSGGSGYVEIYGTNLAKFAASSTADLGSGITVSITYQDYLNPGQINISYSISSGVGPGNRSLSVSTSFGTSSPVTFTIY